MSVAQGRFIRQPAVRKMLGVPEYVKWDQEKLKAAKGGPKKGFREQPYKVRKKMEGRKERKKERKK